MMCLTPAHCLRSFLACICFTGIITSALNAQYGKFPGIQTGNDSLYLSVDSNHHVYLHMSGQTRDIEPCPIRSGVAPSAGNSEPDVPAPANTGGKTTIQIDPACIITDITSYTPGMLPVYYRVKPKETLFRISRIYFNMPIHLLMDLNHLDSTKLDIDQSLLIGWLATTNNKRSQYGSSHMPVLKWDENPVNRVDPRNTEPAREVKGIAVWDKRIAPGGGLIAMHPTARINSMIEIVNPMLNLSVKAKVIGHIPPDRYTEDINIIVSREVAERLGVLDTRFYAILRYHE